MDGGSTDDTATIARGAQVRVVSSDRGRGRQQNRGAAVASGDALLFLHADTHLPPRAQQAIVEALQHRPNILGGNFRLAFDPPDFWNRVFAVVYNLRAARARHYYGDSCLFVRRELFQQLGGFREAMLMEDWEFVQRLERHGRENNAETVLLPLVVTTSARRFTGKRRWRYLYLWAMLHFLHWRGVSGDQLARMYPDQRQG